MVGYLDVVVLRLRAASSKAMSFLNKTNPADLKNTCCSMLPRVRCLGLPISRNVSSLINAPSRRTSFPFPRKQVTGPKGRGSWSQALRSHKPDACSSLVYLSAWQHCWLHYFHAEFKVAEKSAHVQYLHFCSVINTRKKWTRKRFLGGNSKPSLPWANAVFHNFGSQLLTRLTRLRVRENQAHKVWLQYVLILMIHVF